MFFFFSSRRRHTRWTGDWSSDVCSSDLRMEKLWENTRFWKKELGLLGLDIGGRATPASETPITPIIIGDGKLTMEFSRELFKEGVLGTGIAFPTVPEGKARIRTIMTATHTKEELERALGVLGRVGKRMAVLGN